VVTMFLSLGTKGAAWRARSCGWLGRFRAAPGVGMSGTGGPTSPQPRAQAYPGLNLAWSALFGTLQREGG